MATQECPCGHAGDPLRVCRCTLHQVEQYRRRVSGPLLDQVEQYRRRVSGPLLDRIDLQIEVPRVAVEDLSRGEPGESSAAVGARVAAARRRQQRRQAVLNGHLDLKATERRCRAEPAARRLLEGAMERFALSARSYHRVLRVARTIADLEAEDGVRVPHLAEALQYRAWERHVVRD